MLRGRPARRLALLVIPFLAAGAPTAGSEDPWSLLLEARARLVEAGPQEAEFRQVYIPVGFETGDEEDGRIALGLPACLRWDYLEPYGRSYLVCRGIVHHWVHGEDAGRRGHLDPREEPGLDLLFLETKSLQERYRATLDREPRGERAVTLHPRDERAPLTEATLVFDQDLRLRRLSYRDREGNRTRFEISSYRPLEEDSQFEPPPGLAWREDW